MRTVRTLNASWVGAAALTVLSSAAAASVSMAAAPTPLAAPAAPAPVMTQVVAADEAAPTPVTLSFPAPAAPAAPAARLTAAPAPPPAPPAVAPPPVDPRCAGEGWQQRRGATAVERLRRPADARAVPVAFRAARPDVLGLTDLQARRVEVFVRSCERQSDALLLHVLAHELGHVLDATRMTDALRAEWRAARGIPAGTPWFGCNGCTDFATPAGDFAETYAQWQRRASSSRSELAPPASAAQLADLARRFF